jgi:hypothetical protein
MKIGDFVREKFVAGPLMRIVDLIDSGYTAVCQVWGSYIAKRIAVALLVVVGFAGEVAHGASHEESPGHRPTIEKTVSTTPAIFASGAALEDEMMPPNMGLMFQPMARWGNITAYVLGTAVPIADEEMPAGSGFVSQP